MGENETEKDLTPRQLKAIEALLTTGSAADAAQASGVARGTLYRWMKEPAFMAALRLAEGEALRELARRVVGLGSLAADALRAALQAEQPIAIRLRAADLVTNRGPALMELSNILERLATLEEAVNAKHD